MSEIVYINLPTPEEPPITVIVAEAKTTQSKALPGFIIKNLICTPEQLASF